jgi:hypothetical protein
MMGREPQSLGVRGPAGLAGAFEAAASGEAQRLGVQTDPLTMAHRKEIAEAAAHGPLPAGFGGRVFAEARGLLAYGLDRSAP